MEKMANIRMGKCKTLFGPEVDSLTSMMRLCQAISTSFRSLTSAGEVLLHILSLHSIKLLCNQNEVELLEIF